MRKARRKLTAGDIELMTTQELPIDVAAFITDTNEKTVQNSRYRAKYSESCKAASQRNRNKMKQENIQNFKKTHGCYNYWTAAQIEYILNSADSDKVQARKLGKTIYAIQKKRQRELEKIERQSLPNPMEGSVERSEFNELERFYQT